MKRAVVVAAVVLGCWAAPGVALGDATVGGCVNDGSQTQIPGASVAHDGVNSSGAEVGPYFTFQATNGCYSGQQVTAGSYHICFSAPHYDSQHYSDAATARPVHAGLLQRRELAVDCDPDHVAYATVTSNTN